LEDNKLILVADDDPSIRSLLQSFLQGEGFRTVEAKAGRDVIQMVTRDRPDVVIMDVRMPGMSGLDVLDHMKRQHIDDVPVLMMTAYGTSNIAIEAIQRGAYDYVTKPFELGTRSTTSSAIRRPCSTSTSQSAGWLAPTLLF